jgi:transposase-like protein
MEASGNPMPRVINVDKNPAYPAAIEALNAEGTLPPRVRLRQCKYLNNVIEQDHRTVKKRTWLAKGYGSFQGAWRTLQGIEAVHMIRKGRVRWLAKPMPSVKRSSLPNCSVSPRNAGSLVIDSARLQCCLLQLRNETSFSVP